MNVIIQINGREAIPVRAIPFLTDWEMMYPDALANVLAGDGIRNSFTGLVAYLRNDSTLKELAARWWLNHVTPEMNALQDRIMDKQISKDDGYVEWKPGALRKLPARAFVWRDEYVERHNRHQTKTGMNEPLDFSPEIPEAFELLVTEGFEDLLTYTAPAQPAVTSAPVVALVPASDGPAPLPAVPNWKMQIQTEATAHVLRLRKLGCNPTKHSILDDMVKWCVENDVRTATGIYPRANYLRTHVLGGKHWDVPN